MITAADAVLPQLRDLALYATVVALGVSFSFAIALVGTVRASDARRAGNTAAALPWSLLALIGYAAFAVLAVKGVLVVTTK